MLVRVSNLENSFHLVKNQCCYGEENDMVLQNSEITKYFSGFQHINRNLMPVIINFDTNILKNNSRLR